MGRGGGRLADLMSQRVVRQGMEGGRMQQAWRVVGKLQGPWQQKWKRGASIIAPRTSRDLIAPPFTSESSKLLHLVIQGSVFQNGKMPACK